MTGQYEELVANINQRNTIQKLLSDNTAQLVEIGKLRNENSKLKRELAHPYRHHWQPVMPRKKYVKKSRRYLQLVGENRKLRKENRRLAGELAQTRERGDHVNL